MSWRRSINKVGQTHPKAARAAKWLSSNMGVKRYITILFVSMVTLMLGFVHFVWTGSLRWVATSWILFFNRFTDPAIMPLWAVGLIVMILSLAAAIWSIIMLNRSVLRSSGVALEDVADRIYASRVLGRGPRIVAIGGGTGLSNLLSGLKQYSSNITALVAVTDDGGSSGKLRKDLGMIAPGDLTDCYAALSDSPVLAKLLLHRFARGEGLEGHTFGNLLLATLSEERGTLEDAIQDVNQVLRVRGQVLPATFDSALLVAQLEDGSEIFGESKLSTERQGRRVDRMRLIPPDVRTLPQVLEALEKADVIIIGPGSLLTSLIPAILVPEVAAALRRSSAPLIMVANLFSEVGETDGLDLEGHHRMLEEHLGRSADWVLVNSSPVDVRTMTRYRAEGASLLTEEGASSNFRVRLRYAPLLEGGGQHEPQLLAKALVDLIPRAGLLGLGGRDLEREKVEA